MLYFLLLCAADPTRLQAALESADSVQVVDQMGGVAITLDRDDQKKLAKLVKIDGDPIKAPGRPATKGIYEIHIRKGDNTSSFYLIRNTNILLFGKDKELMAQMEDRDLEIALTGYFPAP
jgi:hypothetical protein